MYARLAAFEGGDTGKLKQANEEAMAAGTIQLPDGISRTLLLSNEAGDRRLFITFFDSKESLQAAEERFEKMGDEISEDVRGRRVAVEVYDVVFDQAT